MTIQTNVQWQSTTDRALPVAQYNVNFATDPIWRFDMQATAYGGAGAVNKTPKGITIDNSTGKTPVTLVVGVLQLPVNPFQRQSFPFPAGTVAVILQGTAPNTCQITFWVDQLQLGQDGPNYSAISAQQAAVLAGLAGSAMNPIINSQFTVWPESTPVVYGGAGFPYGPEGWEIGRSPAVTGLQCIRAPGILNSQYAMRLQRTAGDAQTAQVLAFTQLLSADSIQFAGQTVTLGFDASFGANFSPASCTVLLFGGVGTDQNFGAGFTGQIALGSIALAPGISNPRQSITATVPANITQLAIEITTAVYPAVAAGANDWVQFSRFQIDPGSTALGYRPVPDPFEIARCLYFYEVWNDISLGQAGACAAGDCFSTTGAEHVFKYAARKRIAPAISISAATDFQMIYGASATQLTALSFDTIEPDSARSLSTIGAATATVGFASLLYNFNAAAKIRVNARL